MKKVIDMDVIPEVIKRMIDYFADDIRRINHALKVYSFAKTIGTLEGLSYEQQFILELSAILHDIGIKEAERKYASTLGRYQEIEGPLVARDLLKTLAIPEIILNRVYYLIGHHHSYGSIDELDFLILVEADFLVNIDEDEMNQKQIINIYEKYFKTSTGQSIMKTCYGIKVNIL